MNIQLIICGILLIAVGYFSYNAGADSIRAEMIEAVADAESREKVVVKEVIKWKEKERIVYRDKVKTIRMAADPTGCLDSDLRSVGLGGMLSAGSN